MPGHYFIILLKVQGISILVSNSSVDMVQYNTDNLGANTRPRCKTTPISTSYGRK